MGPRWFTALAICAAALVAGCGVNKGTNPVVTPGLPENSTPAGALARFEASYERQSIAEYAKLFTADFTFHFSEQADPLLVQQFGTSWGVDDEVMSASHLFDGFTQADPPNATFGGATSITLVMAPQILGELSRPDSTAHYKLAIVPGTDLSITVVTGGTEIIYEVLAPHEFYLVRGDAAVLHPGQPADSLHWYIRRWDDKSPASTGLAAAAGRTPPRDLALTRVMPTSRKTWGNVKATYHR